MDLSTLEFDVTGELTDDCQYLLLHNYKINRHVLKLLLEKKLQITIKPYKQKRSDAQNRYFWVAVYPAIKNYLKEREGVNHNKATVYAWIQTELLDGSPQLKKVLGKDVIVFEELSFSKMNTQEFEDAVAKIRHEMDIRGVFINEPTKSNDLHEHLQQSWDTQKKLK